MSSRRRGVGRVCALSCEVRGSLFTSQFAGIFSENSSFSRQTGNTSQETPPCRKGGRKKTCSFLYYDLPLNSFTSTDRHATNEETAIKRRRTSDKDAQWQRGRRSDVFPIPCESNKERQHGSLRRTRCSGVRQLSTTQPVPFSRINVSWWRGGAANGS